ncbi:hypothetical protein, partial [Klebsiella pneumoniae]|uniref:hypothetical protein n=1 Tax=Klebsiella pneumoniae TaxID=573 RepID=UPI00272F76F6
KDPITQAYHAYNGDSRFPGEGIRDRYLQRAWPDFDSLLEEGLEDWARALYQPLIDQAELLQREGV